MVSFTWLTLSSLCFFPLASLPLYRPLPGPHPPHKVVIYSPGAFISGLFLVNWVESFQTGTGWWPLWQQQLGGARPDLCGNIWEYIEECLRPWLWRACSIIYGVMWWCERPRTGNFKESSIPVSNMEKLAIPPLNLGMYHSILLNTCMITLSPIYLFATVWEEKFSSLPF